MATQPDQVEIRDVWAGNLEDEFAVIRDILDDYPYVAVDAQFPGVVHLPVTGNYASIAQHNYATRKANVDALQLYQLGLTFSDEHGRLPPLGPGGRPCSWQFNFQGFELQADAAEADRIDLLRRSGIDFARHAMDGVDTHLFALQLTSAGVVINSDVRWVTFDGGYGFGYLLKLLTGKDLPDTLHGFFGLTQIYFPVLYDIKHLMKFCNGFQGGLNDLADLLGVDSARICHRAGSDSLLTARCFTALLQVYFNGSAERYQGVLYGLGAVDGKTSSAGH